MAYTTNWFISGVPADVNYSEATVTGGPFYDKTGYITSLYGPRDPVWTPNGYTGTFHTGLDMTIFPVVSGVYDIRTLFQGTVIVLDGVNDDNGLSVGVLSDSGDWYAEYYHLDSLNVTFGQHVGTGHILGKMGTTGYSTGPHLHLGLMYQWTYVDPLPVLMSMRKRGQLILGSQYFDTDPWFHDEFGNY